MLLRSRSRDRSRGGIIPLIQRLTNAVRAIFSSGTINGAVYDPSLQASLNQISTGTTPVTAVTDPVGLVLDTRLGLALGPELVINGTFDTDTTGVTPITVTINRDTIIFASGALKVTAQTPNNSGTYARINITTVVGKSYKVSADLYAPSTNSLPRQCGISAVGTGNAVSVSANDVIQNKSIVFVATGTTTEIQCSVMEAGVAYGAAGDVAYFDNITVKLLEGNQAIQATAAARPTWQVDAGGHYYISFLGIDDSLTSATGGGGDAGFFWCGVIEPTGGAGTNMYLWNDTVTTSFTGYQVLLGVTGNLSIWAGNGTSYSGLTSTEALAVGNKGLLTVWDDGTNLNVQVNNGAIGTVARPVVVAGSAGYTIGARTSGSNFFIGNLYPSVYARNTGLTAAQRASAQAWVRSKAGM